MIKKITALILSVAFVLSYTSCAIKKENRTTRTNVVTCINNYPIDSHLINDEFYVEVNNLKNYGFDVKLNDNVYNISISENEMKPSHNVQYYSEKELKRKGKKYSVSTSKASLNEQTNITGYDVEGNFCIPFIALESIATGYEYKKDVKNIISNKLKGMGKANEYKYIKLRAKDFDSEEFFALTFEDIKNVFGDKYTKETEENYTSIKYDDSVCPIKMYFNFSEKDTEDKLNEKKVRKVFTDDKNVILMETKIIGLNISDVQSMVDNTIIIHEENPPYAVYRYYKKYNLKFNLDKNKKILSYEVEKK